MKRFYCPVYLLLSILTFGCKAPAQSTSANHLNGMGAMLFLENGDSLAGKVSLNNEVLIAPDIEIQPAGGEARRLHLLDVKGYKKDGQYYELKHTENHIHPRSGFYFMKRLTPQGSGMHLYEHLERRQKGKSMYDIVHVPVYYLQLPGEKLHRVYPSFSKKLVPHFHKKMSAWLKECPELQAKVHDKKSGYFYSRLDAAESKKKEVLLRIIAEYNSCLAEK